MFDICRHYRVITIRSLINISHHTGDPRLYFSHLYPLPLWLPLIYSIFLFGLLYFFKIPHIYHIIFTHSSVNGHSGCFHMLAVLNNAEMNIGMNMSFQIIVFMFFG